MTGKSCGSVFFAFVFWVALMSLLWRMLADIIGPVPAFVSLISAVVAGTLGAFLASELIQRGKK